MVLTLGLITLLAMVALWLFTYLHEKPIWLEIVQVNAKILIENLSIYLRPEAIKILNFGKFQDSCSELQL